MTENNQNNKGSSNYGAFVTLKQGKKIRENLMTIAKKIEDVLKTKAKFIFITGGVVSSLGKGLASASLASILQTRGFKVRLRKLDP